MYTWINWFFNKLVWIWISVFLDAPVLCLSINASCHVIYRCTWFRGRCFPPKMLNKIQPTVICLQYLDSARHALNIHFLLTWHLFSIVTVNLTFRFWLESTWRTFLQNYKLTLSDIYRQLQIKILKLDSVSLALLRMIITTENIELWWKQEFILKLAFLDPKDVSII